VHVSGPDASFSFTPVAPAAGSPALFDGGGSTDGGNDIANFAWVFGDGSTGTGASLDHTYAAAGQYTARLTVTNAAGQVDSVSHPVVVGPASVTPPTTPTTTGSVTTSPTTTTVAPPSTTTTVVTAPTTTSTTVRPPASAPQAGRHLTGTSRADHLVGGSGPDVIRGRGGNDVIVGGRGRDTLEGGAGNDRINARDGAVDVVRCGTGRDVVIADRVDRVARDCEVVRRR
jgi:Ca2+-binding RTX toxin-like protein